jgi:exopolysaccharide biosynthesis polyprenyl glycosylphosphotransferase
MNPPLTGSREDFFQRPLSALANPKKVNGIADLRRAFLQSQAVLVAVDTVVVLMSGLVAHWFTQPSDSALPVGAQPDIDWWWIFIPLGGWYTFAWLNDLYDIPSAPFKALNAARVLTVCVMSTAVSFLAGLPLASQSLSLFLLYFLSIVLPLDIGWRLAHAALSKSGFFLWRVLIVGVGDHAQAVAAMLRHHSGLSHQVVGYVSEIPDVAETADDGLPVWNASTELASLIQQLQIHQVVIATDSKLERNVAECLVACQATGISILSISDLYDRLFRKVPIEYVEPAWILDAVKSASNRLQLSSKRCLDLTIVLFALPVFMLVFALIAPLIKLTSPGPVLYRQLRCGRGGKPFWILKFRTMFTDAEKGGKPRWATANDPRITRVGYFLRKTHLDEVPQLFNILYGEMSFVGPRPERPEFVEELEQVIPYYRARLLVKPGLTGWAQVNYPYGNTVEDALIKLQYDIHYIRHWSLWLDIYTLFHTVSTVLKATGT